MHVIYIIFHFNSHVHYIPIHLLISTRNVTWKKTKFPSFFHYKYRLSVILFLVWLHQVFQRTIWDKYSMETIASYKRQKHITKMTPRPYFSSTLNKYIHWCKSFLIVCLVDNWHHDESFSIFNYSTKKMLQIGIHVSV